MGKYFGTDGIRGVANASLTLDTAYKVGRFLSAYAKKNGLGKIVIGKDTRLSSSMFEHMMASAIASSGSDAYLIGYCSTPSLAFIAQNDGFDMGVMISASHNPYYDNGIKVFSNNGVKLLEEVELQVEDYIDNPVGIDFKTHDDIGRIFNYPEGLDHYKEWIKKLYPNDLSKFKVLLDCAHGSNTYIAEEVLKDLGCNVVAINNEPTGINCNNGCGSTHLESLKENIVKEYYDIGFAFDGDADRCLAVNNKGEEINGDKLMFVLTKYLKKHNILTNDTLVVTGYSNIGLHKACKKMGVKMDVVDNGDKYVLESMLKNDYAVGGEQSGHIIIKKDSNFGDGLKTALCTLAYLLEENCSIDEACKELVIYPQLLVNQHVKDKKAVLADVNVLKVVEDIKNELSDNGQILVRASGTEPLVRVMVEAESNELCKELVDRVLKVIETKGYIA